MDFLCVQFQFTTKQWILMNRALYITEIVLCGLQIVETYIFKEKMNYYKIEFDNEYQ